MGLTWWSLGLIILASLMVGHFVRVSEFVPEVAISAMLVLGVSQVTATAWDRVLETLIGAVVGLLFNLLFVPPVWVQHRRRVHRGPGPPDAPAAAAAWATS